MILDFLRGLGDWNWLIAGVVLLALEVFVPGNVFVWFGVAAIIPAFLLTFAFHTTLIEWLKRPLPPDKTLVTLGVVEPFTTAVKVSGQSSPAL